MFVGPCMDTTTFYVSTPPHQPSDARLLVDPYIYYTIETFALTCSLNLTKISFRRSTLQFLSNTDSKI